jgi:hypothetical protein
MTVQLTSGDYATIKGLADNGQLVIGQTYQITDITNAVNNLAGMFFRFVAIYNNAINEYGQLHFEFNHLKCVYSPATNEVVHIRDDKNNRIFGATNVAEFQWLNDDWEDNYIDETAVIIGMQTAPSAILKHNEFQNSAQVVVTGLSGELNTVRVDGAFAYYTEMQGVVSHETILNGGVVDYTNAVSIDVLNHTVIASTVTAVNSNDLDIQNLSVNSGCVINADNSLALKITRNTVQAICNITATGAVSTTISDCTLAFNASISCVNIIDSRIAELAIRQASSLIANNCSKISILGELIRLLSTVDISGAHSVLFNSLYANNVGKIFARRAYNGYGQAYSFIRATQHSTINFDDTVAFSIQDMQAHGQSTILGNAAGFSGKVAGLVVRQHATADITQLAGEAIAVFVEQGHTLNAVKDSTHKIENATYRLSGTTTTVATVDDIDI